METAPVTIQAAFRGFAVRQCQPLRKLRQIAVVRTKLEKLRVRVGDPSYVDKLCSDRMENRKMKEEIMALLLELDAIQGVLPVVREIRKSVTRDVVQIQEIVDAIKVDPVAGNDTEEVNPRQNGQANALADEQATPRAGLPINPPLRRVMSLDDNVYPEQSYMHPANKKTTLDGAVGDGSNRSSDEDAVPRRRPNGWVKSPPLQRSTSGNHKGLANKKPLLARTCSEVQRKNSGVRNPLLGRSISEVLRKPSDKSPLLGRSISEVQRKKRDVNSSPVTTTPDGHKSPYPKTPPISDDRVSSADTSSPPTRHKVICFDKVEAAIRIQSTYRGHLSRRSRPLQHLRNISMVNNRLRELNQQLVDPVCAERLRMDGMERLKWSEEITALLLKLDSVQGVVQAIRDIRKSVTREVIKLQEKVDTIIHEADILSRIAGTQNDSGAASDSGQFNFGPEILDKGSADGDGREQVVDAYPKASALFEVTMGDGQARAQVDPHLWDDKFVDLQKPVNFEQGFNGSTASYPCEKGNNAGEQQLEQGRDQRKLKRVSSGSVESRFTESRNACEIQQRDILSSARFPTRNGRSLILSSVSAAGTESDGKQQPRLTDGEVDCQHPSLARIQKKVKRVEKEGVLNGTLSVASDSNLDSSAAGRQDQLTVNPTGYVEKPAGSVLDDITPANGIPTVRGYCCHTSVCSAPLCNMRTTDESSLCLRQVDGDTNDVPMLPHEEFHSDREQGCHNGRSPRWVLHCGHHPSEERACKFLRSRGGRCEEFGSGFGSVSTGQIAGEDNLLTTSKAPGVNRPSEDQREVDRLTTLADENTRLKLLLSQVLEHAEDQAHDLRVTKRRLAILEKERVQATKKEDMVVRKTTASVRRRR